MDIKKLQRAIVDGLEDVKAQHIQVFDTEHISALFERVIVASGTSNRQTKALAFSVRDAIKAQGFAVPRMEGESNGEWIIVDCGAAVVHIMQPTIREYYHLEELWGEKPVIIAKPASKRAATATSKTEPTKAPVKKTPAKKVAAKKAPAKKAATPKVIPKAVPVKKTAAKKASAPAASKITRTVGVKTPVVKKVAAKKVAAKKVATKKTLK